jgi:hypothetical protein
VLDVETTFVFPVDQALRSATEVLALTISTDPFPEVVALLSVVLVPNCVSVVWNHSGTVIASLTVMLRISEYELQVFVF